MAKRWADWEAAVRRWVADTEAAQRKAVKHGGTHKPKGDEIRLLQVQASERIALALEGILDCFRFSVSPLGKIPLGFGVSFRLRTDVA